MARINIPHLSSELSRNPLRRRLKRANKYLTDLSNQHNKIVIVKRKIGSGNNNPHQFTEVKQDSSDFLREIITPNLMNKLMLSINPAINCYCNNNKLSESEHPYSLQQVMFVFWFSFVGAFVCLFICLSVFVTTPKLTNRSS